MYPEILGGCPIATPTVVVHRLLVAEGFRIPRGVEDYEDVLAWIDVAAQHEMLGIDEPLTVIEWSRNSAALNIGHEQQIARLSAATGAIAGRWKNDPVLAQETMLDEMLRSAFGEFVRLSSAPDLRASEQQAVPA